MALRLRVVDLYRRICHEIPKTIAVYDLDFNEVQVRKRVRALFDKNAKIQDPELVAKLLHEGEQRFREVVHHWQQKVHILNLFETLEGPPKPLPMFQHESDFLREFYQSSKLH